MHYQILQTIVDELAAHLLHARVERVFQSVDRMIILVLNKASKRHVLLISPVRVEPRLHLVSTKPLSHEPPHGFVLYLRSHVPGSRITGVSLLNEDRIVDIRFAKHTAEYRLLFEVFGSAANLILTDQFLTILTVYYPTPLTDKDARLLLPGLPYGLPARPQKRPSPEKAVPLDWPDDSSPSKAAETYYRQRLERQHFLNQKKNLLVILRKKLSKVEQLRSALSRDLDSAKHAEEFRRAGDLILANIRTLKNGLEQVNLMDHSGESVTVILDRRLTPAQNADRYFRRYKKAKNGRNIIAGRLHEAEMNIVFLRAVMNRAEDTNDSEALQTVCAELPAGWFVSENIERSGPPQTDRLSAAVRRIWYNGWEIMIGKSAAGNDYLTMKMARPNDLWLHAEGLPGSHVLIRNPGSAAIPDEVLLKAASLAAYFSKGRRAGKVPVTYASAGHVKKPSGAKPGSVVLMQRKTIVVKPEDSTA